MTENATICIFTNQTATARGVEFLPEPEKLRDERTNKKRKIMSNVASSGELKVSSAVNFVVKFPDQIEVLQNASSFARVVEPITSVTEKEIV